MSLLKERVKRQPRTKRRCCVHVSPDVWAEVKEIGGEKNLVLRSIIDDALAMWLKENKTQSLSKEAAKLN